ncbi:MAG: TIGR02452 family protein, partial [Chloroflexota bacterium]
MAATGSPSPLSITAAWDRPLVAATGDEVALLIQIAAPPPSSEQSPRRAPIDVAFVLDRSGSMAGDKLALVKEAVSVALGHLRDDDRAALVIYDHAVETLQTLAPTTPRVKAAMRLALHGIDSGGSTNLAGGWLTGCEELTRAMGAGDDRVRIRRTLLLTDGLANVGMTSAEELTKH